MVKGGAVGQAVILNFRPLSDSCDRGLFRRLVNLLLNQQRAGPPLAPVFAHEIGQKNCSVISKLHEWCRLNLSGTAGS